MKRSVVCSLGVALSLLLAASASTEAEASDSSLQNVKVGVLFLGESNTPYYGQLDLTATRFRVIMLMCSAK